MRLNPSIAVLREVHVPSRMSCRVDGVEHAASSGYWTVYVPDLQLKLLHAVSGTLHCLAEHPTRQEAAAGTIPHSRYGYTKQDWIAAFSKSVTRRAVENYLCAVHLHNAGLGPKPLGLCVVKSFTAWYSPEPCLGAGLYIENLLDDALYPTKMDATLEEIRAAGVIPDQSGSCIREQIRGYVSDLNSVVGAMPDDGEDEIHELEKAMLAALESES